MNINRIQSAIEAILFASGDPVEIEKIAQVLEIDTKQAEQIISNLSAQLDERNSGLCVLKLDDKYQLCTKPDYADEIRSVLEIKRNTPLSQAAFEVLAVIAYNQPVTKAFVEQIRGVDCSGVISSLCQKSLIEEKGRLDLPGRPLLYGTTPEFLRCFSISSLDELPPLPEKEQGTDNNDDENDEQTLMQDDVKTAGI